MRILITLAGAFVFLLLVVSVGSICAAIVIPALHIPPGAEGMTQSRAAFNLVLQSAFWMVLLAVTVGLVFALKRLLGGRHASARGQEQLNETLMIQEIHAGLSRMEDRIEALETILFDRAAPSPSGHARPKAGRSL